MNQNIYKQLINKKVINLNVEQQIDILQKIRKIQSTKNQIPNTRFAYNFYHSLIKLARIY